jgi:CRP/FNR family transcriptional regulator, cyclic AMP receptor protein
MGRCTTKSWYVGATEHACGHLALLDGDTKMQGTGSGQGFWTLLTRHERDTLSDLGMSRDYPAGAIICLEGDPATHVFILVAGWVKILSSADDGHEIVLALRGDGDLVGDIAGATTGRRTATIQAVDAVHALIVQYDKFNAFLDANPAAGGVYRRMVTQRWNDASTMLRDHAVTTGAQRLARLLLELADRHGRELDGAIYLAMPLTQDELASMAGTSRATVTRALSNWRKRRFILTGQRHITILDHEGLRKVAGQQR